MRQTRRSAPEGFPRKWWKRLPSSFRDSGIEESDSEALKGIVIDSNLRIMDCKLDRDSDVKLQDLKETVAELEACYDDMIQIEMAKAKYALYLLRTRR